MLDKFLKKPLSLLWICIVATRILLTHLALGRFLTTLWLDALFLLFVISITVAEIAILYKAGEEYATLPRPFLNANGRLSVRGNSQSTLGFKVLLLLLLFCLPYALWESRRGLVAPGTDVPGGELIGIIGMMAGTAFNLLLVAAAANAIFVAKNRSIQPQSRG